MKRGLMLMWTHDEEVGCVGASLYGSSMPTLGHSDQHTDQNPPVNKSFIITVDIAHWKSRLKDSCHLIKTLPRRLCYPLALRNMEHCP